MYIGCLKKKKTRINLKIETNKPEITWKNIYDKYNQGRGEETDIYKIRVDCTHFLDILRNLIFFFKFQRESKRTEAGGCSGRQREQQTPR